MRIVHCVLTRKLFGSERYCADLSARQAALGHDVTVIVDPASKLPPLLPPGVKIHRLGRRFRRFRLRALLNSQRPEVAHTHLAGACKLFAPFSGRIPVIATLHSGYKEHHHAKLNGLIALTRSDMVRSASFKGPVKLIGNWVPGALNVPMDARAEIRRELGIDEKTYVVGCVARLHRSKNPQLLVNAYKAAKLSNAALVMIGDGADQREVERMAADDSSIRILGYRDDARRFYAAFDLFVLASRFDPFPLVLLEAMAAGLPIATTSIEGPGDFMPSPPTHLFPSEDAPALTAILKAEHARGQRRQSYDLSPFDREGQIGKVMAFYDWVRESVAGPSVAAAE